MALENCLTFALKIGRYYRSRDHLVIRKSHFGWFPHFGVMFEFDDYLVRVEYVPINPVKKWIPPLFFSGEVRETYYKKVVSPPQELVNEVREYLKPKKSQD